MKSLKFYIIKYYDKAGKLQFDKRVISNEVPLIEITKRILSRWGGTFKATEISAKEAAKDTKLFWYTDHIEQGLKFDKAVKSIKSRADLKKLGNITKFKKFFKD